QTQAGHNHRPPAEAKLDSRYGSAVAYAVGRWVDRADAVGSRLEYGLEGAAAACGSQASTTRGHDAASRTTASTEAGRGGKQPGRMSGDGRGVGTEPASARVHGYGGARGDPPPHPGQLSLHLPQHDRGRVQRLDPASLGRSRWPPRARVSRNRYREQLP